MDKLLMTYLVLQGTLVDKLSKRRESGQGSLEYVGMFAVAAIIVVAIIGLAKGSLGSDLVAVITAAITKVKTAGA
ncbi:MAG TPA: hypothetical protein VEX66_05705 [Microlunatus sp.]|jgi:hypothetical protein|nr:hypothetical protein [Microlunatus sp.]